MLSASRGCTSLEVVGPSSVLMLKLQSGTFSVSLCPVLPCADKSLLDVCCKGTLAVNIFVAEFEFVGESSDDSLLLVMRLETRLSLLCHVLLLARAIEFGVSDWP